MDIKRIGLVGLFLTVLLIPMLATGAADALLSLENIQAVAVIVEDLKPDAVKDGLDKNRIQEDVSGLLREAGIRVLPAEASGTAAAQQPHFVVAVNTLKDQDGLYAFSIELALKQWVTVVRTGFSLRADTWSIEAVGSIGSIRLNTLRTFIKSGVEKFIADWRQANRTRTGAVPN